jgi:hypothetical protein
MKMRTHKTYGACKVSAERLTAGGNKVVDAICAGGQQRVLLTEDHRWEEKQ